MNTAPVPIILCPGSRGIPSRKYSSDGMPRESTLMPKICDRYRVLVIQLIIVVSGHCIAVVHVRCVTRRCQTTRQCIFQNSDYSQAAQAVAYFCVQTY